MPFPIITPDSKILRGYGDRYTHPTTGEVYGRSDYDNLQKLSEIGAVPLREEAAPEDVTVDEWEIVDDPELHGGKLRRPSKVTPIPLEQKQDERIAEVKSQARMILSETDWEMLRAIERTVKAQMDAEGKSLADSRDAVREASNQVEADILLAKSVTELKSVAVDLKAAALELEAEVKP